MVSVPSSFQSPTIGFQPLLNGAPLGGVGLQAAVLPQDFRELGAEVRGHVVSSGGHPDRRQIMAVRVDRLGGARVIWRRAPRVGLLVPQTYDDPIRAAVQADAALLGDVIHGAGKQEVSQRGAVRIGEFHRSRPIIVWIFGARVLENPLEQDGFQQGQIARRFLEIIVLEITAAAGAAGREVIQWDIEHRPHANFGRQDQRVYAGRMA